MSQENRVASRTQVVRDPSGETSMYIGAAVCACISVGSYLLVDASWILWVSIPAGLLAICSFAAGFSGCYDGECPHCRANLSAIKFNQVKPTACKSCRCYYEGRDGWLTIVDPARVCDEPLFYAPLPDKMVFPNCCCVCGAPATRYDKESGHKFNAAWLAVGKISTTKISLDGIPYCGQHKDGVIIEAKNIHFRSYPYLRTFCEMNGLVPGPSKTVWDEIEEQAAMEEPEESKKAETVQADVTDQNPFAPTAH